MNSGRDPHTRRKAHHGARRLNEPYDPAEIEARWKARWAEDDLYRTPEPAAGPGKSEGGGSETADRPTYYVLEFFPYPSGEGLSVGHVRNYVIGDVVARYRTMCGDDVLHPMGWDAFGLPAENEARQKGRHPAAITREYAANYRRQMELVSVGYDWSRELFSTDPDYYRWTQWMFLLLHSRGLAYRGIRPQWWCPTCQTVLANEQVTQTDDGPVCWRDHPGVIWRDVAQWFFRITDYADRLLADLDGLDWPEGIVAQQRHWIGRGDGMENESGGRGIDEAPVEPGAGRSQTTYRMRDWSIGRQRFWGAPIPIVHCAACGEVPESDLPVRLPDVSVVPEPGIDAHGRPVSPLASIPEFWRTACPRCGGPARRETDTMDGFACSSWYFLRFASPRYADGPFDPAAVERWLPVDLYIGGAEHAVMHLLYARFWTKVLFDAGYVSFDEPFARLRNQGMILDETGAKMSKSRPDHVVTPDEAVANHGADALRVYELFIAPFDQDVPWSDDGIAGVARWLRRVWRVAQADVARAGAQASGGCAGALASDGRAGAPASGGHTDADPHDVRALRRLTHQTVRDVTASLDDMRFNVAVARLMALTNVLVSLSESAVVDSGPWDEAIDALLRLMAPLAPHVTEELWSRRGRPYSIHRQPWPTYDAQLAAEDEVEIVVQVDGVVRDRVKVPADADEPTVRASALASPEVIRRLSGAQPRRVIVVPGRLVNVVTR